MQRQNQDDMMTREVPITATDLSVLLMMRAQQLLFAAGIAADDLQGLRLQLITLLGQPLHDLSAGRFALGHATG